MKRVLVYSHDTFGLGNIRRMLAISRHLLESMSNLSILLVTGSPVIHSLRLPDELDYIKLPCLTRTGRGEYTAKYLSSSLEEVVRLRSELILSAARHFHPDLLLVDKKPLGVKRELVSTFDFLKTERPRTRTMLILRDVLDRPQAIVSNWTRNGHYEAIKTLYDRVLILGQREIYDPILEYDFPAEMIDKVEFCGYIGKEVSPEHAREVRESLGIEAGERLILVTPGGGEDGYRVIDNYLPAIAQMAGGGALKTVIVSGPEMPDDQRERLRQRAAAQPGIVFLEFAGDLVGLMAACDAVISMAGYNTICEILSLRKKAIVIPRVRPTEEQWIRAERMAHLGLFTVIHPDELNPSLLARELEKLLATTMDDRAYSRIDLCALPAIARRVRSLLRYED